MTKTTKSILSICAMSFIVLASSATSPALSTIAKSFPDASSAAISSIATISCLTSLPFTIIAGLIAGKKVKFRTISIVETTIVMIGGVIPFFSSTLTEILIGRAVLGIGNGLTTPIIVTLTLSLFDGPKSAKQFSRNMMATNAGAVIFQLAGGYLCNYGWKMPFLSYLVVAPVLLIIIFFLPEPDKIVTKDGNVKARFDFKEVVTPHVLFWGILHFFYMIFFYPYVTEMSSIITGEGIGTSMTAAIVLSLYTGAGVLGGYLFYFIDKKIGYHTFAVGFGLGTIGYFGLLQVKSIVGIALISMVFGIGYGMIAPAINYYLGRKLKPEFRSASVSTETLFSNLGSFSSPFVLSFLRSAIPLEINRLTFFFCLIFYALVTIGFGIYGFTKKAKDALPVKK